MWPIEILLLTVIFATIVALLFLYGIVVGFQMLAQKKWRSAQGVLEEAALQCTDDFDSFISIRYKFHIDQQPYWGNQDIRVGRSVARSDLRELCPIGQKVGIYYDPADPESQSRLKESDRERIASA